MLPQRASRESAGTDVPSCARVLRRRNHELYDQTSNLAWKLGVYEGLHNGRPFINLAGAAVLDAFATASRLGDTDVVLDLCCGPGAACGHLAERFGCRVVGVEINARQVRSARAYVQSLGIGVRTRVRIVQGDATAWRSPQRFQAVVCLDASMLIPDLDGLLRSAYRHLAPGGQLLLVAIGAGIHITPEWGRFAWESDAMVTLASADKYRRALGANGFEQVRVHDITALALRSSRRIQRALIQHQRAIEEALGTTEYAGWRAVGNLYSRGFTSRRFAYLRIEARRP